MAGEVSDALALTTVCDASGAPTRPEIWSRLMVAAGRT